MDEINQKTWKTRACVKQYGSATGFTDVGERAAFAAVTAEAKDQPILDLGVGGGRTVPLLNAISKNYVALDYTRELVQASRERYPLVRVVHGDARDLSRFADESFKLVVFSYNGIDSVDQIGRLAILREVYRVLEKDGVFLFSTHNLIGRALEARAASRPSLSLNPVRLAVRLGRSLFHAAQSRINQLRYATLDYVTKDYAILNDSAQDHGIMVYYTSLDAQLRQLVDHGFRADPLVYDNVQGRNMKSGDDASSVSWFHFIARK
jgi:SAM-dependent methyltransferase